MNKISNIPAALARRVPRSGVEKRQPQEGFGKLLQDFVAKVDGQLKEADQKAVAFAVERKGDLHEVMVEAAKADISLRLLLKIRNKLVEAYQEIMRMQI